MGGNYKHKQHLDYFNESKKGKIVIYTRVSSSNQKDDLINQVDFLQQYANAKGIIVDDIIEDFGSGLNYNRKKWNNLIDVAITGQISKILITHKDRFIRFGYDWFEHFLLKLGVELNVVNNEKLSPQE